MKAMHEKHHGMKEGRDADHGDYFPEKAHVHKMERAGEVKSFKYPDTEKQIHEEQQQAVHAVSKDMPKHGYRH